ncbi:hypothetical protein LLG88_00635 [bacterium]|nr:hypothetical protein [bacterium]
MKVLEKLREFARSGRLADVCEFVFCGTAGMAVYALGRAAWVGLEVADGFTKVVLLVSLGAVEVAAVGWFVGKCLRKDQ